MSEQVRRRRFDATPGAVRELATNAVRHANTPFDVVVETNGHIRIEVEDGSTTAPGRGMAPL